MAREVKGRRRYDSPLRRSQAAATRRQILAAAQPLFERDGYAATSVAAIARAAGVSPKTVYLAFGAKSGVLRALWHLLLRGEQDDVPVAEQPWFREVLAEPDPARQLALNMRNAVAVRARAGAVLEAIRTGAASDPDVAELWDRIQREFHANQRAVVESLAAKGALRAGLDVDAGADVLWALNHPSLHRLLTADRGWSAQRYERWMTRLLQAELLA